MSLPAEFISPTDFVGVDAVFGVALHNAPRRDDGSPNLYAATVHAGFVEGDVLSESSERRRLLRLGNAVTVSAWHDGVSEVRNDRLVVPARGAVLLSGEDAVVFWAEARAFCALPRYGEGDVSSMSRHATILGSAMVEHFVQLLPAEGSEQASVLRRALVVAQSHIATKGEK